MNSEVNYKAGLYCRLSKDDDQRSESVSIATQRSILTGYCMENGFDVFDVYIDDGYSGLSFDRPGFKRLLEDVDAGKVNMIVTKDLSRLGRDYIMTGYYSEIFFPTKGVRYIALGDNYDSKNTDNDIAPFKNILNDMYAKDISRKIKSAKHQHAREGKFIGGQAPYGYMIKNHKLCVDLEAAETVKLIFALSRQGLGEIEIGKQLEERMIVSPGVYKELRGEIKSSYYRDKNRPYHWCSGTIHKILNNPVYLGELVSLKTETINYKTKKRVSNPEDCRIITSNSHEAIISEEEFLSARHVRQGHTCPANNHRESIFRGLLYCDCCGHHLSIAHRKLTYREDDLYRCMHHHNYPDACPKTHAVYHSMLYPYVLSQVKAFAKSLRRRKIQSPLSSYGDISELSPEILNRVISRIEVGHVTRKASPARVIQIYWKLV